VANAVGPIAAILHSARTGAIAGSVELPFWIMLIGALGISLGLFLFGPKLILMVGEQITRMNPMRAFCVALSAAVTVIIASALGLPVSSTHIAVGAVFGVGFFREWYTTHSRRRRSYVRARTLRSHARASATPLERQELIRRKLVRRSHVMVIVAAWLITVPAAAGMAAMIFAGLRMAL
jgi:PiT family inorganic phosphate transporter